MASEKKILTISPCSTNLSLFSAWILYSMSKILRNGHGSSSIHPVLVTGGVTLRIALLQRQMSLHSHMSDSGAWAHRILILVAR